MDVGKRSRIDKAEVVNGVVRATDVNNNVPRIVLEAHQFFGFKDFLDPGPVGWGPFVAIHSGSNEIIHAIGAGLMVGFRTSAILGASGSRRTSFNLGVGYIVDPNTKVLGDGIKENRPLPPGETQVRFKETTQGGIMFLA